jgi:hypothetical protein
LIVLFVAIPEKTALKRLASRALIVFVVIVGLSLGYVPPTSHAAPAANGGYIPFLSSTGPGGRLSHSTSASMKVTALYPVLFAEAPVQAVTTQAQSNATGFPTGTTYKRITRPGCFQPTVKEQNEAREGKLTEA